MTEDELLELWKKCQSCDAHSDKNLHVPRGSNNLTRPQLEEMRKAYADQCIAETGFEAKVVGLHAMGLSVSEIARKIRAANATVSAALMSAHPKSEKPV